MDNRAQGAALVVLDELLVEDDEVDEEDDEPFEDDELVELLPELDESDDFELDEDESELLVLASALTLPLDSDRLSVR